MKPFRKHKAVVAHLDRENVDTDQIIPKQFLKRIERTGYGPFLFFDWRRIQEGPDAGAAASGFRPQSSCTTRTPRSWLRAKTSAADRPANTPRGRSHDYGFRCVIASSFADIFHSNAGKNGLLLVTLPEEQVQTLMARAASIPRYQLTVSLEDEMLHDDHGLSLPFSVDPFRRECLLLGLDDIGLSLKHGGALEKFEQRHDKEFWLAPRPADTESYLGAL